MLQITRPGGVWRIGFAHAKLAARGALPGAYGYDLAVHALRRARVAGVPAGALVSAAMPVSWMVNSGTTSRIFQRWLSPPLAPLWAELSARLEGGTLRWPTLPAAEREAVARDAATLAGVGTLAGMSKVLAALHPETVPLMDDAALWYAKDAVPRPASADAPLAGPELFVPMLDWFAESVEAARDPLTDLARHYSTAPLDAAQVLDRLVWFESWGYRHSHARPGRRWWWVKAGEREAIVPVDATPPARPAADRVDLETVDAGNWRDEAQAALDGAWA